MKNILFLFVVSIAMVSCGGFGGDQGELIGADSDDLWFTEQPYGMVLIPGGSFTMGKTEENRWGGFEAPPRTVTVREIFMDETEITNSEYKEFVYWVKDSIVRNELANYAEGFSDEEGDSKKGIAKYKFLNSEAEADPEKYTPYQNYMLNTYGSINQNNKGTLPLNWKVPLYWRTEDYPDEPYAEVMDQMYLPQEDYGNNRIFDVSLLKYSYVDEVHKKNGNVAKKNKYVSVDINVYPDTAVWIKDFEYSHNDVMADNYFWHAAFEEYPVVGVSHTQAEAFCNWRTKKKLDYLKSSGAGIKIPEFRLPTEAEWEFAARGGIENGKYPWGGPYVTDVDGYYLANFKPNRNNFAADGFTYTVEALSFTPNDYGLFNMSGNVSEWTSTAYNTSSAYMLNSLNVDLDDPSNKRKVIRGGSWKDIAYFLEVSTRDYEYADSTKSYIGFRTVQDYLGNAKWGELEY